MQYLSKILIVNLFTGRDFDKSFWTDLKRLLHFAAEIFWPVFDLVKSDTDDFWPLLTLAVMLKPYIWNIKTINK